MKSSETFQKKESFANNIFFLKSKKCPYDNYFYRQNK